jgi:hypothetical protein
MRSTRQLLATVTLFAGFTSLGIGLTAGAASAATQDYCPGGAPNGSLQIATTPAAGSNVAPGSNISVTGSWNSQDFEETDRFVVCTSVDGVFNSAASSQDQGLDNDGEQTSAITVPADTPEGADVCVYGVVKGRLLSPDTTNYLMVSDTKCFTTAAVTTTTQAPTTTTTAAPIVEPNVIESGNPSPVLEVAPAPAEAPAPLPVLPRTGAGLDLLAGFGSLAVAAGGVASFFGRRRPSEG